MSRNLAILPCVPASVRGYKAVCAVADEICFMGELDQEIITALRPTLSSKTAA